MKIVVGGFGDVGSVGGEAMALELIDQMADIGRQVLTLETLSHLSFDLSLRDRSAEEIEAIQTSFLAVREMGKFRNGGHPNGPRWKFFKFGETDFDQEK